MTADKELISVQLMCHFERVNVSTFLERIVDHGSDETLKTQQYKQPQEHIRICGDICSMTYTTVKGSIGKVYVI